MMEGVSSVAFSPDGQWIAAGAGDGNVHLWDILSDIAALVARTFRHSDRVSSVAFSPDGSLLAAGAEDGMVKVWDMHTGLVIDLQVEQPGAINSVAFSPDGRLLAVGGARRMITLWDIKERRQVLSIQLPLPSWAVHSVSFNADGTQLIASDDANWVRIWEVATGEHLRAIPTFNLTAALFSPSGGMLAIANSGMVELLDVVTLTVMQRLRNPKMVPHPIRIPVSAIAFSPDGKLLASGAWNGEVRLWDATTGSLVHTFAWQLGSIDSMAFSPDGRLLATVHWSGRIQLSYIGNLVSCQPSSVG